MYDNKTLPSQTKSNPVPHIVQAAEDTTIILSPQLQNHGGNVQVVKKGGEVVEEVRHPQVTQRQFHSCYSALLEQSLPVLVDAMEYGEDDDPHLHLQHSRPNLGLHNVWEVGEGILLFNFRSDLGGHS